ncbi:LCP family protein [Nonomuraea sp. NPDC046802]|uniref:LCP family protein n=1 Tax=Nonomuraea sp. NPDC046802 TaxID=3154919 RepID=UPI0033F18A70
MDDLKLLRDLGGELEHEPPATLLRQRERMLNARPRRRWNTWWTAGLVAVATAAAVAVPTVLIKDRPTAAPPAASTRVDVSGTRNVLLIGSDTREGEGNKKYGASTVNAGARSDTIVIVHLPADRTKATAVGISRDTMVSLPRCSASSPARTDMINSAYGSGGAACLKKSLEKLTGLTIQHSIEVDFAGFKRIVDALGGVEITLPKAVDDRMSKLKLPAGKNHLDGEAALGYARMRYYDNGSDIDRMKRQQVLVKAMVKKAKTMGTQPDRLRTLLSEVRKSVKTNLDLESMFELATQLQKVDPTLATVPWEPYEEDPNRIQWKQPEADKLFATLK